MIQPRTSARVSKKLRERLDRALINTGQGESNLVRTALEEFFSNHPTPAKIIAAVLASIRHAE